MRAHRLASAMEISLSIEETNKLRRQLGLREIPVDGASTSSITKSSRTRLDSSLNKATRNEGIDGGTQINSAEVNDELLAHKGKPNSASLLQKLKSRRKVAHLEANDDEAEVSEDWLNNLGKKPRNESKAIEVESNVGSGAATTAIVNKEATSSTLPRHLKLEPQKEAIQAPSISLFDDEPQEAPIKIKKIKKKPLKSKKSIVVEPFEARAVNLERFEDEEDEFVLSTKKRRIQPDRPARTDDWGEAESDLADQAAISGAATGLVFDETTEFLGLLARNDGEKASGNHNSGIGNAPGDLQNLQASQDQAPSEESKDKPSGENVSQPSHRFNIGVAGTLNYLKLQAAIDSTSHEDSKQQRDAAKQAELTKLNIEIESRLVREQLEDDASYRSLPKEEKDAIFERYLDERLRDKNLLPEPRKRRHGASTGGLSYKPQVRLAYKDKEGRELLQKEAFKELSHKFHGSRKAAAGPKTSGKLSGSEHIL